MPHQALVSLCCITICYAIYCVRLTCAMRETESTSKSAQNLKYQSLTSRIIPKKGTIINQMYPDDQGKSKTSIDTEKVKLQN